jgi:Domain of unknown function (DUF3331)
MNAMRASAKPADPWKQTVRQLTAVPADTTGTQAASQAARPERAFIEQLTRHWDNERPRLSNDQSPFPQAVVRVIERPSSATAIIYWSDAGTCHYGYQGWRVTTATGDGVCALSGEPIHRGDSVYRPSQRDPKPQNAAAMILSSSMPANEEAEADLHG